MDPEIVDQLMPPHTQPAERAMVRSLVSAFSFPVPITSVWNPATAPAAVLPFLAWALSVDEWDPLWSEERQRDIVSASIEIHRRKGTLMAVEMMLNLMGYGSAKIIEDKDWPRIGGAEFSGGALVIGAPEWVIGPADPSWADYWVDLLDPVDAYAADRLAARLKEVAPVRSRLRRITLTGVMYVIGDDLWRIGDPITLGGIYNIGGT